MYNICRLKLSDFKLCKSSDLNFKIRSSNLSLYYDKRNLLSTDDLISV